MLEITKAGEITLLMESLRLKNLKLMEKISSIFIGNIYGHKDAYAGAVFGVQGLCPAIKANSGGNTQPMIVVGHENNERTNQIR